MPSPFPGMNPYLERAAVWDDFRVSLAVGIHLQLAGQLSPRYVTRIGSREYVHEPTAEERRRGDAILKEKLRHVTITDLSGDEVVTIIEILSPTNKNSGPHRDRYARKRSELLCSQTHFVEIDLRSGPRLPPDDLPTCDYCAVVSRVEERPRAGVWPWRLRDPMPVVPIPLRTGDADATLDLKAVIDQLYDAGGYGYFTYAKPPEPRLAPDDQAWAAAFVPTTP